MIHNGIDIRGKGEVDAKMTHRFHFCKCEILPKCVIPEIRSFRRKVILCFGYDWFS